MILQFDFQILTMWFMHFILFCFILYVNFPGLSLNEPLLHFVWTGSPFTVKVFGDGRMKESITRKRQAPSIATVGSTCDLNLKIPGELWHHRLLHLSLPVPSASSSSPPSPCPSLYSFLPAGFRELVPHGFGSGAPDPDVHPQQSHLHSDRAYGDQ